MTQTYGIDTPGELGPTIKVYTAAELFAELQQEEATPDGRRRLREEKYR